MSELSATNTVVEIDMVERHFHDGPLAGQIKWVPCRDRVRVWSEEAKRHVSYYYKCGIDKMVQERNDG